MVRKSKLMAGSCGIITGASSGIGRALACRLADRYSARLVLNARNSEKLEDSCRQVESLGGKAIAIPGDISDPDVQARLIAACCEEFGGIDLLVNNAGMARPGALGKLGLDDWRQVFEVNFFSALSLIYQSMPIFEAQQGGKIVNVSSVAGKVAFAGSVCYASSKFALTAMSEGMAAELSHRGIDVITVCPGWVRTDFFDKNNIQASKNPTLIASRKSPAGWLMRNLLSITAEDTARDIDIALSRGGSHELVMTVPGKIVERLNGLFPDLIAVLNRNLPPAMIDSSVAERTGNGESN